MNKSITLITILLCTLYVGHVQAAGFFDGNQLFQYLKKHTRDFSDYETGVGTGYIIGIFDTSSGIQFCPPSEKSGGITVMQLEQIIYNYMQKHPELWNKGAITSVINALEEVYPCK